MNSVFDGFIPGWYTFQKLQVECQKNVPRQSEFVASLIWHMYKGPNLWPYICLKMFESRQPATRFCWEKTLRVSWQEFPLKHVRLLRRPAPASLHQFSPLGSQTTNAQLPEAEQVHHCDRSTVIAEQPATDIRSGHPVMATSEKQSPMQGAYDIYLFLCLNNFCKTIRAYPWW